MSDGNEKLYDFKARSDETATECKDPSLTVQSDAVDADINTIVKRYGITGQMPQALRLPEYSDYEDVFDFHSAQLAILEGEKQFMSLPADIRAKFENDAGQFFSYAANPDNIDGLRELGLAKPLAPAPEPVVTEVDKPA